MTGRTGYTAPTDGSGFDVAGDLTDAYEHFDALIGETVSTASSLPSSGTWAGRMIMTLDTGDIYVRNAADSAWVIVSRTGDPLEYDATGPATQTDYSTTETQAVTLSVPMVSGRKYKISGQIGGSQVTNTGTLYVRLRVGATLGTGSSGTEITRVISSLSVASGGAPYGFGSWLYTATATASNLVALTVTSTASAFRVAANQAQLLVEPVIR